MKKTFMRWYLFTTVIGCGVPIMWYTGTFHDIFNADVTKISFVIYAVFVVSVLLAGVASFRVSKRPTLLVQDVDGSYLRKTGKYVDICWFLSETMMTLGLIGTVAGMIYLFGQIFVEIDPSNPDDLKEALSHMATGLSTAMYTTICGMVGAMVSKILLMNIEFGQEG